MYILESVYYYLNVHSYYMVCNKAFVKKIIVSKSRQNVVWFGS